MAVFYKPSSFKIKWISSLIVFGLLSACSGNGDKASGSSDLSMPAKITKPNIVIIYADDMGYGDLNVLNKDSKIPTPNLDQLAKEGMSFTDGHSASTVCSPSRYSMLTGRYHWRGHLTKGVIGPWGDSAFEQGTVTIADMLKHQGYQTGVIGKWHLGMTYPFKEGKGQNVKDKKAWRRIDKNLYTPDDFDWDKPVLNGPTSVGFDYYFGDGTINYPPYVWMENDKFLSTPTEMNNTRIVRSEVGNWQLGKGPKVSGWDFTQAPLTVTKKAVEWLHQQSSDKPFFLYFPMQSPHSPVLPARQFQGKSGAGAYGDYVVQTDWMAGQVLQALKDKGFDKNTLVIFTSDNGPELYAYKRIQDHEHYSMGNWRGVKRDLWEGGHRVPFIVKYPEKIKPNTVNHNLISQVDIMATVASIIGSPLPQGVAPDSKDFSSLLFGKPQAYRDSLVYHAPNNKFALRQGDWVLVEAQTAEVSREPVWIKPEWEKVKAKTDDKKKPSLTLYNIKQDPQETKNLYQQYPDKAKAMHALLKNIRSKS